MYLFLYTFIYIMISDLVEYFGGAPKLQESQMHIGNFPYCESYATDSNVLAGRMMQGIVDGGGDELAEIMGGLDELDADIYSDDETNHIHIIGGARPVRNFGVSASTAEADVIELFRKLREAEGRKVKRRRVAMRESKRRTGGSNHSDFNILDDFDSDDSSSDDDSDSDEPAAPIEPKLTADKRTTTAELRKHYNYQDHQKVNESNEFDIMSDLLSI